MRTQRIKNLGGELFETAKECQQIAANIYQLTSEIKNVEKEIKNSRLEGNFTNQVLFNQYHNALKEQREEWIRAKERKQKELLVLQEKTSKAIVERKIVEKLKEKRYSLWELEMEKAQACNTYKRADRKI